ncbi:MAG: tRNA (guanosine(37)-N1)-methyltransferase TrmD [Nitrospirae bacterium]|nr:tRNA (guanosine(37)-N1)-methyltransferase TrmD [Nitrospirota bacterium]
MQKKFGIITIFPDMVKSYLGCSILKRAIEKGIISVEVHNLRDYATDKHKTVDDYPYGGGPGMVMKPEPFYRAVEDLWPARESRRIIMLSPRGRVFSQDVAREIVEDMRVPVFLCGRYEAIDERVRDHLVDDEISIGDYVLTGGELPALVIIDAVSRLIPDVLGDDQSAEDESFSKGLLDYPHFTRPEEFRGMHVPRVLLSGNHEEIRKWRKQQSLKSTLRTRPELLKIYTLSDEEKILIEQIKEEQL